MKKNILVLAFNFTMLSSYAQFAFVYDFTLFTTQTGSTFTPPSQTSTGVTFGSFVNNPSTMSSNAANRFSFQTWPIGATDGSNTFSGNVDISRYYTWTVTPAAGFTVDLNSITFSMQRTTVGPRQCVLRSSLDNYTSNIPVSASTTNVNMSFPGNNIVQTTDVNGSPIIPMFTLGAEFDNLTTPVTFRMYAFNAETALGYFSADNVTISGVSSVNFGTSWSNTTGPTSTVDANISGLFATDSNGAVNARNLNILQGGNVIVNAGAAVTLTGALNNTQTSDKFVVASNASLFQTNAATNTGSITVNRDTAFKRLDYTYWSSPVAGQNLLAFSPQTLANRFYTYNGAAFANVPASSTGMAAGTGYSVRAPNTHPTSDTAWTGTFVGVPNNGDVTVTVPAGDYKFVGNPYPSTVSGNAFLAANPGTLYFWTHANSTLNQSVNNNAAYNLSGGTVSDAGGALPNGTIQVGQGFMLFRPSATTVSFTNTMRVPSTSIQFFKSAQNIVEKKDRLWLNLFDANTSISQTLLAYLPNTTAAFDESFDGKQIQTDGTTLSTLLNDDAMVIQARDQFNDNDIVKLQFKTDLAGSFKVSLGKTEGVFENNQHVFLKDNLTSTTHDLKNGDYSFASQTGTFNTRFEIVYRTALATNNVNFDTNSVVMFTKNNDLNIFSGNVKMKNIEIFDLQGRLIFEKNNINDLSAMISTEGFNNQVGIVKITAANNDVISKKVVF